MGLVGVGTEYAAADARVVGGAELAGTGGEEDGWWGGGVIVVVTYQVGYYLPVLLVAGAAAGLVIGVSTGEVLKRVQKIGIS